MKKLNWGIIGSGVIANEMAQALLDVNGEIYAVGHRESLYCLGIKLTFWTVNSFVKICRRVSQMRFFHQTIKTFICPRLPLCINHCCHAFQKSV